MVLPSFTLWTLDGPPEESSDTEDPPPIPPKPSAEEQAKAATRSNTTSRSEVEADSEDEEFFDTPMAEVNEQPEQDSSPTTSAQESFVVIPPLAVVVQDILDEKCHTATFPGTSQYASGGNSACGLASMNAVRLAFELCSTINDREALISALIGEEYVRKAMEIVLFWPSEMHLEAEPILELPMFADSLQLVDSQYREVRWRTFSDAILALQSHDGPPGPRAVLLTRPPEMISVMHIPIPSLPNNPPQRTRSVYIIFDSHPRPGHQDGAALQIFPSNSPNDVADYLADLFQIDSALMNDPTLEWHVQLLGQISCHFFAPASAEPQNEYAKNMIFLKNKQEAAENKRKLDASEKEKRQLRSRVFDLEQEVAWLGNTERMKQEEIRELKSQVANKDDRSHSKDSAWAWDTSVKRSSKGKGRDTQSLRTNPKSNGTQGATRKFYNNDNWAKPEPTKPAGPSTPSRARTLPAPTSGPSTSRSQGLSAEDADMLRSLEVAMALQEEFDNERTTFAHDQTLAQTIERPKFDCAICMESFTDEAIALIEGCNHSCCRECMRSHVQSKIDERRYPITCPFCVVGNDEEGQAKANVSFISPLLVETIGVTSEQFIIYVELQLAEHSIMIDCRRIAGSQSAFVDRKDFDLAEIITCPMPRCTHSWCKQCNQSIAGGVKHSCDGSAELETLMNQRGWKHCPGCRTPIERSAGCNHMTCSTPGCNMHFCYICGGTVIRGGTRNEIQAAVSNHFRSCALFDVPREA